MLQMVFDSFPLFLFFLLTAQHAHWGLVSIDMLCENDVYIVVIVVGHICYTPSVRMATDGQVN